GGLNNPSPRVARTAAGDSYLVSLRSVSSDYTTVMEIPLRAGRFFGPEDRLETPRVAVVSEQFRNDVFGDRNPVGQRLTFNFQNRSERDPCQVVIVGVIGNVRHMSLAAEPFREVYLPSQQSPLPNYDLVVRTRVDPASLATQVHETLRSMDPDQAIGG